MDRRLQGVGRGTEAHEAEAPRTFPGEPDSKTRDAAAARETAELGTERQAPMWHWWGRSRAPAPWDSLSDPQGESAHTEPRPRTSMAQNGKRPRSFLGDRCSRTLGHCSA